MLTLKLWRMFVRPSKQEFWRVIAPDAVVQRRFGVGLRVASFFGFFVWILLPFVLLPFLVNFLCFQLAVKIAQAVSRQRELGQRDLLAITPVGSFPFVLEISRAYLYFTHQEINRFVSNGLSLVVLMFGIACSVPLTVIVILSTAEQQLLGIFIVFALVLLMTFLGEYVQLATLAVLLGILAGSSRDRVSAQAWAMGMLLGLQISVYGGWLWAVQATAHAPIDIFLSLMFFAPLLFVVREIVIFATWQVLRYRFKGEMQTIVSL